VQGTLTTLTGLPIFVAVDDRAVRCFISADASGIVGFAYAGVVCRNGFIRIHYVRLAFVVRGDVYPLEFSNCKDTNKLSRGHCDSASPRLALVVWWKLLMPVRRYSAKVSHECGTRNAGFKTLQNRSLWRDDMKRTLLSVGLGAGLMYLFDPELGEVRRSILRDKLSGLSGRMPKTSEAIHDKAEALAAQADDLTTRVDEAAAEVITNVGPAVDEHSGDDTGNGGQKT
jgi:hypothetical protein